MDYRFIRQKSALHVIELDEGWEVLTDPRWPAGLYRQRSDQDLTLSANSPKPAPKRHFLGALTNPLAVKGMAIDMMV